MGMTREQFDLLVRAAITALPPSFREAMENIQVVVEDQADPQTLAFEEIEDPMELTGYYHGVPLPERYGLEPVALPDRISIYRLPIELESEETGIPVDELVHEVVQHEVGHYFGLDEEELDFLQHPEDFEEGEP